AYYRLKQVDFDGTAAYSEVITVERDCEAAQQLEVYPIPVGQGQELQVRYYNEQENANLQIFDMNGRIIKRIPSISKGWNQIALDISELSNGVYYLVSDTGMAQRFVVVE
ncbi:MAG: T9SS type A sorting domain-containing protein, partial [Bacteroidota bacterium]